MNNVLQPIQSKIADVSVLGIVQVQKCEVLGIEILNYLQLIAKSRKNHMRLESTGFQPINSEVLDEIAENITSLSIREVLRIGLSPRLWIDSIQINESRLLDALSQPHPPKRIMPAQHAALVQCYINRLGICSVEKIMCYETFGLSFDACHRLLNANQQQLSMIVNAPCILSVCINWNRLKRLLMQIEQSRALESLQDKLLKHRAPHKLMKNLYGWSRSDFAERRRLIGLTDTGRPKAISDEYLQPVVNYWLSVSTFSIAERYLYVSIASGYCISSLVVADIENIADSFSKRRKS